MPVRVISNVALVPLALAVPETSLYVWLPSGAVPVVEYVVMPPSASTAVISIIASLVTSAPPEKLLPLIFNLSATAYPAVALTAVPTAFTVNIPPAVRVESLETSVIVNVKSLSGVTPPIFVPWSTIVWFGA